MGERGISLLELVLGLLVTSILFHASSSLFRHLMVLEKSSRVEMETRQTSELIAQFLKVRLEGTKGFQNVSFKVPGTAFYSQGAGFFVQPDKNLVGEDTPGIDRIFILHRETLPAFVSLAQNFSNPSVLEIRSSNPNYKISDLFNVGNLLVLSTLKYAEVLKVVSPPAQAVNSPISINSSQGSYDFTYSETGSPVSPTQAYQAGDPVFKASLLLIGIQNGELKSQVFGSSTTHTIARGVTSFSASYHLNQAANPCGTIQTPSNSYTRNQWTDLNSGPSHSCYSRLDSLRIEYSLPSKRFAQTFGVNQ